MGRAPCCDRSGLKKGPWTAEEDQKLVDYIQKHGHGSWRALPKKAGLLRCGKSCRLRWTNYLRPDIKRGRFSFEEEETIIQLHKVLGNKWSAIATRLPGRTDNEIKNYWNTHIRKRLIRMGIDPVTHISTHRDLSNLYNNPATAAALLLNLYGLLGLQPATELIKIATNLWSFQCQSSGVVNQEAQLNLPADTAQAFQAQQLQDPAQDEVLPPPSTAINAPNNAHGQLLDEELVSHMGAANEGQVRGAQTGGLWLDVVSQYSNISDNDDLMISTDNLDPFFSQLLTESSCFDRTNNLQNCDMASGSSSTPASSLNNINSPLTNVGVEDVEGDSSCSGLFEFQVPYLSDISDYYT